MIRTKFIAIIVLTTLVSACSANEPEAKKPGANSSWVAQIGGLGPEVVFDIAETSDGRVCALGTFHNSADFGGDASAISLSADNIQDIFLACYAADGRLETAVQFGTQLGEEPRAIAALPGGDVLIAGYFANSFGVGKSAASKANGAPDIFLSRINARGEEVWTRTFGGKLADSGNSLAVTPDGHILLAGSFQEVMLYEAGNKTQKMVSAGNRDAFVLKLDSQGTVVWGRAFGGERRDEAQRVTSGKDGLVLVAGAFQGEAKLAGDINTSMSALGSSDAFLLAFDANGDIAWSRQISGKNRENVGGLASDSQGRIYMTGSFLQMIVMPDGSSLESAGSTDIFVSSFDHQGSQLWAGRMGGKQANDVLDASITTRDTLLIAGYFQGTADLAPGEAEYILQAPAGGNSDAFVVELDHSGALESALHAGGQGVEMAFAVSARTDDNIAVAGLFNQQMDLGLAQLQPLAKRGKTDVFLALLNRRDLPTQ